MNRVSLKVTGAQGQGVNSVGEICGKGLKRAGYCVFGYREYMSLIKGGHSSYQVDISAEKIESTETAVDILVCFNHHGLEENLKEVKPGGIVLHYVSDWKFGKRDKEYLKKERIKVVYLPVEEILRKLKARPILANVLITSVVWALLGRAQQGLRDMVREQFGHKGEAVIAKNFECIKEGFTFAKKLKGKRPRLPKARAQWRDHLFITGSEAMGLGIVHAGCRMYCGYPMTPSSPLLSYLAQKQNETGMIIKQAEDEITAAQMMSGAMCMGTRAATGTSGGGFDLMTETVSMNGMIENPSVFVLAQRPGPATGLPTWTAQGDLLLAVGSAHGEFARLVMSVSDSRDSFNLMPEAFNYAERFQTPVIVMTDKHTAEGLFTQPLYDQKVAKIDRGCLVTETTALKKLKGTDRYDPRAKDGISPRWLPGAEAETYCAQADEHNGDGSVDETAGNTIAQFKKRLQKMEALKEALPEPEIRYSACPVPSPSGDWFGGSGSDEGDLDLLVVSWGSNKGVILDALRSLESRITHSTSSGQANHESRVGYLHYTYLWPMKTERLKELMKKARNTVLIECNYQGQLGMLIKMESGIEIRDKILKYDGRPFFYDELLELLWKKVSSRSFSILQPSSA